MSMAPLKPYQLYVLSIGTNGKPAGILPVELAEITKDIKKLSGLEELTFIDGTTQTTAFKPFTVDWNETNSSLPSFIKNKPNVITGLTGDVTASGTGDITATLSASGVTPGTYKSVVVDAKGRVISGTSPTTLAGYGITDAQPLAADLTSIAGLSGTSGLLRKTAANTWSLDTSVYALDSGVVKLTGDQTVAGVKTLSSNPVLSAGTANGVAYLNGSKVLTTGSALTFNGTTITSTGGSLYLNGTNSDAAMTGSYVRFGTNIGLQSNAANSALVAKMFNGSTFFDALTLSTSGNLGLGVTPSAWVSGNKAIQVSTYTALADNSGGGGGFALFGNAFEHASGAYKYSQNYFATLYRTYAGEHQWFAAPSGTAGGAIAFTRVMTLDASGNLVLGGTTALTRLSVTGNGSGIFRFAAASAATGYGVFQNSANVTYGYLGGGGGGAISAGSDTDFVVRAQNNLLLAIGNSEKARIDSSGNLLVGGTSTGANGKLQVTGNIGLTGNTQIRQSTNSDGNTLQLFATQVVVGSSNATSYSYAGGGLLASLSSAASAISLDVGGTTAGHRLQVVNDGTGQSGNLNYSNAGTSRFFVNSLNGNVGVGTTTPLAKLDVSRAAGKTSGVGLRIEATDSTGSLVDNVALMLNDASSGSTGGNSIIFRQTNTTSPRRYAGIWGRTSSSGLGGSLVFGTIATDNDTTGPLERMRIDSTGSLLVNTTTRGFNDGSKLHVQNDNITSTFTCDGSSGVGIAGIFHRTSATGGEQIRFVVGASATTAGSITSTATTTTYGTTSDYRLKTVTGPVTDAGHRIDALQPVEYTWKSDGSRTRGFLAHQFQEVYAGSVTGTKDAVDAEGKPVYQQMQASTPEVIADLVAEIQSLRKRLAAAGI